MKAGSEEEPLEVLVLLLDAVELEDPLAVVDTDDVSLSFLCFLALLEVADDEILNKSVWLKLESGIWRLRRQNSRGFWQIDAHVDSSLTDVAVRMAFMMTAWARITMASSNCRR